MSDGFSLSEAKYALQIANLPQTYEIMQQSGTSSRDLKDKVGNTAPAGTKESLQVIQISNTTCVMVYNPQDHSATIAFDPTTTTGDKFDNVLRDHKAHPLGGNVHGGNYSDLLTAPLPNDKVSTVIDAIGAVLYNYQQDNAKPLTVNFTGFSKGGGQTIMAAGELIADSLFSDKDNMRLGKIYTFGTLASVDQTFANNFNSEVKKLGGEAYTIEIQGDNNPTVLTKYRDNFFTGYDYTHVGEHVFISTDENYPFAIINPTESQLIELRQRPATADSAHSIPNYKDALSTLDGSDTPQTEYKPPIPPAPALQR